VPLLRLAGAVQAALTWQHKVHAAFLSCPLLLAFCLLPSPHLPSPHLPFANLTPASSLPCHLRYLASLSVSILPSDPCESTKECGHDVMHIMILGCKKLLGEQVGQYSMESRAEVQQYHSPVCKQASGISTRASLGSRASQTKRAPSGEVLRAVQQMEAQLRVTRQDALQLATAVVRLEKEKAVLQAQGSGIATQVQHVSLTKARMLRLCVCKGSSKCC